MRALLQRVASASVEVQGKDIAVIGRGILALVAIFRRDDLAIAEKLARRIARYRLFGDAEARLNLNLLDIEGELLLVPQFSLAASTSSGLRPSFSDCAPSEQAEPVFRHLVEAAQAAMPNGRVSHGRFGADMQVRLINDGPMTLILDDA